MLKAQKLLALLAGLLLSMQVLAGMGVMIDGPWIREAPPGADALAGYMTLNNHTDTEQVLVSAESAAFGMVMLHRTVMQDGVAKMVHQDKIAIPAGGSLSFSPNGYHLMLMKPKQALKAGDKVGMTLHFADGSSQSVEFVVRAGGAMQDHGGMGGMDMGNMHE